MFTGSSEHSSERGDFRPLDPEVSRPRAQFRLRRKRRWFTFRSDPLRLELIRLPVYIVEARFAPSEGAPSEGGASKGDSVSMHVAVDGLNGSVERLDRSLKLESTRAAVRTPSAAVVPGLQSQAGDPRQRIVVPPNLNASEALSRARSELPWLSLHFALRRGIVYSLVDMDVRDRVGYPYWILHTVRRQRRDFRALDGISGKKLGSRGRSLVVQGYILLARHEGSPRSPNPVEEN